MFLPRPRFLGASRLLQQTVLAAACVLLALGFIACDDDTGSGAEMPELTGTVTIITYDVTVGAPVTASMGNTNGTGAPAWVWERAENAAGPTWTPLTGNGADTATYTPQEDDLHMYIRARISYTNTRGWKESGARQVMEPLPPLPGTAAITGDTDGMVKDCETLTASLSGEDAPVDGNCFQWQWAPSAYAAQAEWAAIDGAADSGSYTVEIDAVSIGSFIRVVITNPGYSSRANSNTVEVIHDDGPELRGGSVRYTAGTVLISDFPPIIGGTIGMEIAAEVTPPSNVGSASPVFLWFDDSGLIEDAASNRYTPVIAGTYSVSVTYAGFHGTLFGNPIFVPNAQPLGDDGVITYYDTTIVDGVYYGKVGEELSAWAEPPENVMEAEHRTPFYQWQSSPDGISGWQNIANATTRTYTPQAVGFIRSVVPYHGFTGTLEGAVIEVLP